MFNICRRRRIEKQRRETLSEIVGARFAFEMMMQRAMATKETLDDVFVKQVLARLEEIEKRANEETDINELDSLAEDAEEEGHLRAYICPPSEISDEGNLSIDRMEELNIPKAVTTKLRASLGKKLEDIGEDKNDFKIARSALRFIFHEYDSWAGYTDEHDKQLKILTYCLSLAIVSLSLLAILVFHYPCVYLVGLLFAGAAGSCASVMAKLPVLEVALSGELQSYPRRALARVGVGIIASLVGCALLGSGFLSIRIGDLTFGDVIKASTDTQVVSRSGLNILISLGVPMLFGWTERALTSFDQQVFGGTKGD